METQTHERSQHCKDFKGKEWDAFILFTENKKGFSALFTKRALKSLGRHRIVQKPMQEKRRTIDLSSCKSYIWTKKKKSSY